MAQDAPVKQERRKTKGRRKWDKEIEAQVEAIANVLQAQGQTLNIHLVECSKNHDTARAATVRLQEETVALTEAVSKVLAFVEPQITKAEDKAKTWARIKEAAMTDAAAGFVKALMFAAAFAVLSAIIPLLRSGLTVLLVNLSKGG